MPCGMKIQPIDFNVLEDSQPNVEAAAKPVIKSRFKRLFERQFLKTLAASKPDAPHNSCNDEFEPSSVCLAKMVRNFIEDSNDKQQQQRCGKNRCNCFNGNSTDSSDEEGDSFKACEVLKGLVSCLCVSERNLLAETARIVERNKIHKRKDENCRKIVADGIRAVGYDASVCKSKWESSPSFPAGEYEYVDVVIGEERLIIDIDFRSEFEIARPTKAYKMVLQALPNIFIGKADLLEKIIGIVSEAAKLSLKKKGMPIPPWRKAEYVKAKWLSPFTRIGPNLISSNSDKEKSLVDTLGNGDGCVLVLSDSTNSLSEDVKGAPPVAKKWELPEIKPKSLKNGVKIVTGLASLIEEKP